MKNILYILICFCFLTSCNTEKKYKSDILIVEKIANHTYKHTSFLKTKSFGNVPCNGIIVVDENKAIIFDTPINKESSKELIDWVENNLKCKITAIIPTHFHVDCLGGLDEFHKNDIPSFASKKTIDLLKDKKTNYPQSSFETSREFSVGKQKVVVSFFGEGHTKDNIVAYLANDNVLFGGCLVKGLNARKGNLADANINEWSSTVQKIKKEYPNIKIVVPGHGKIGNSELLDYTIELFK